MTLATVKSQLARIIEGATPTTKARGLPSSFKRIVAPNGADPLDARRFYFRLDGMAVVGPHIEVDGGFSRVVDSLVIVVCYPEDLGGDEVDDHVAADYVVVLAALLDQGSWAPDRSGIVAILPDTGPRLAASTIEREQGIIRLVIPLTVEHML